MAALPDDALKQRIINLFRGKGAPAPNNDGNVKELLLKHIWQPLGVEKKAVNRILHNSDCFKKVKDSPPLWQCTIDPTATPDTTSDIGVSTEPDAVIRREVDSPSKKERLKPDVLRVLDESPVAMTALQIAKKIGWGTSIPRYMN